MKKYNSEEMYQMLLKELPEQPIQMRPSFNTGILTQFAPSADSFIRSCDRVLRLIQQINFPNTNLSSDAFNFFRSVYRESEKN
jgi:hypothetical protein